MSKGFSGLLSLLGVWLDGKKSTAEIIFPKIDREFVSDHLKYKIFIREEYANQDS